MAHPVAVVVLQAHIWLIIAWCLKGVAFFIARLATDRPERFTCVTWGVLLTSTALSFPVRLTFFTGVTDEPLSAPWEGVTLPRWRSVVQKTSSNPARRLRVQARITRFLAQQLELAKASGLLRAHRAAEASRLRL